MLRAMFIACVAAILTALPACAQDEPPVDAGPPATAASLGENGLWVSLYGDTVTVHWLTADSVPGILEVLPARGGVRRIDTPAGTAHRAAFMHPARGSIRIHYGSAARTDTTVFTLDLPRRAPVEIAAVDSLYIVGDTHGDFDALIVGLSAAGLIDDRLHWTGGRRHLAFAGDLTDRGPDVLRLLWFVYRLEREAAEAGGRVHVLLGNHEIMVALADLRYVHPRELDVARRHGTRYDRLFDTQHSLLGRWLASKPATIRIGRVLIAHGGVSDDYARIPITAVDDTLEQYIGEELFQKWADSTAVIPMDSVTYQRRVDFFWHPRSIFWYRGYVSDPATRPELADVLKRWRADVMVVGHTATPEISAHHDGALITAHTRRYGSELLLLVRGPKGMQRFRIKPGVPPEPF